MNILFLGGAKRVSMGRKFLDAAKRAGLAPRLFSYELTEYEPIASIATVIVGKRWRDPEVLDDLKETVRRHSITVVVPFVDGAIEIAGKLAEEMPGLFVPACNPGTAVEMFDKALAALLFEKAEIAIPRTMRHDALTYPCIAKPRWGSASQGIVIARSASDLEAVRLEDYLIQEYIENAEEYTVDCYVSMSDGRITAVSPRRRLATSGGEATATVTVDRPDLSAMSRDILQKLGLRGAVTLQFLCSPVTLRPLLMEINPRLGGGAVTAVHAGADIPAMIIAEALGQRPESATVQPGVLVKRYLEETVFYEN